MEASRRASRRRADQPFELRKSGIHGRGAFATRRIRAGQRIVEYTGERITVAEGDRRYPDHEMKRHHTFLFTVDENTAIDGKIGGNDSRYINHSCVPNCEAVTEGGRIFIYAKKNIQPGIELTFDYQYERFDDDDESVERFYRCACGSPKCRGTILKPKKKVRAKKTGGAKASAR
jgi:SET domain-containing protein